MLLLIRRSIAAHKMRLALTALSVVLGVAFVSGTYVFTDGINKSFTDLYTSANQNIDIVIRRKVSTEKRIKATEQSQNSSIDPNKLRVPASLIPAITSVPGVAGAEPSVQGSAQIIDSKGTAVGGGGPPTLAYSWSSHIDLAQVHLIQGRGPTRDGEIAIDMGALKKAHAKLGDTVTAVFSGGRRDGRFKIVGVVRFGKTNEIQGATLAFFDLKSAQKYFDAKNGYDLIYAKVTKGESKTIVRDRIQAVLPVGYQAITGAQSAKEQLQSIGRALKFLRYFTLGFAAISLFVATFTIFNTFTITIAQRLRELGLLRAVGASRSQVVGLVLAEGLAVGVIASIVGVGLGVVFSAALHWGLNSRGFTMPASKLYLAPRTVVISLITGITVTLFSVLVPALRAATVPPMEAIRSGATNVQRRLWVRIVSIAIRVATLALGIALLAGGLYSHSGVSATLSLVGAGFAMLIIGVTMVGPVFVRPVVAVIGWPLRHTGIAGELAARNTTRNARRTMTTAAALMIGLGLASFAVIQTSSLQETFSRQIDRSLGADLTLNNVASAGGPAFLNPEIAVRAQRVAGVSQAIGVRVDEARLHSKHLTVMGASQNRVDAALRLVMLSGTAQLTGNSDTLVSKSWAKKEHLKLGSTTRLTFPGENKSRTLTVRGIYDVPALTQQVISYNLWPSVYPPNKQLDFRVFVTLDKGAKPSTVKRNLERALKFAPYVRVQDATTMKKLAKKQINQILTLLFGLLAMSVLIALFGIINTLALSVFERTREIGLLRAVGALRGQVSMMVLSEGVLVAVIGALLGMALGIGLGAAGIFALKSEGVVLQIPLQLVLVLLVVGVVAGIISAALPAWRAARTNVLEAIASE